MEARQLRNLIEKINKNKNKNKKVNKQRGHK
jgi:hypothetical protein